MSIAFTRRHGGYVVTLNRVLAGLILTPEPGESRWRFVSQWGDVYEHATLHEAQACATETLLWDRAVPA